MKILIDHDKCKKDRICGEVCPRKLFVFDENNIPAPIEKADELCISCGQCLSHCPPGAISLDGTSPDDCKLINKSNWPTFENIDHLIRSRRSIRAYRKKTVERSTIIEILDTARYAPTGSNTQLVQWVAVNEPEKIKELVQLVIDWFGHCIEEKHPLSRILPMEAVINAWENNGQDMVLRGAPALIVNHSPENGGMHAENCAIAMTYFELAAVTKGVGSCWAGFLTLAATFDPKIKDMLKIPENNKIYSALMIGYPKFQQLRIPERKNLSLDWV